MGKPTGFLEYPRQGNPAEAPRSASGIFVSSTPGWAGRSAGARGRAVWSAASPSASPV